MQPEVTIAELCRSYVLAWLSIGMSSWGVHEVCLLLVLLTLQLTKLLLGGNNAAGSSGGVNALNGNQVADGAVATDKGTATAGDDSTNGGQANGGSNTITG